MQPVVNRANFYLDRHERYAYEQILLLAVVCLTRKAKVTLSAAAGN